MRLGLRRTTGHPSGARADQKQAAAVQARLHGHRDAGDEWLRGNEGSEELGLKNQGYHVLCLRQSRELLAGARMRNDRLRRQTRPPRSSEGGAV